MEGWMLVGGKGKVRTEFKPPNNLVIIGTGKWLIFHDAEFDRTTGNLTNGKIRLLYESNPISKLIEEAGGLGSTGFERILNIKPTSIHQRIPTYIGSTDNIVELCEYFATIEM